MTVAVALGASPERSGTANAAPAAGGSQFARLGSVPSIEKGKVELGPRDTDQGGIARTVSVLADSAERDAEAQPSFPVRGPFNWGQEGAAFGGPRGGRAHEGQDVMSRTGTPEVAITAGKVLETGNDGGRGNFMNLYDPARKVTYVYMHMNAPARAKVGDTVKSGQRVGEVGCTGSCFGDHLHFEIREGKGITGAARDPRPFLERLAKQDRIQATLPPGQS